MPSGCLGVEKGQMRRGVSKRPPARPPAPLLSAPRLPGDPQQHNSDQLGQGRGRKSGHGLGVRCLRLHSHGRLPTCLPGRGKNANLRPGFGLTPVPLPLWLRPGSPAGKSRGGAGVHLPSGVTQFPVVSGPHLPALPLALATAFVPLCLGFPGKLVKAGPVFRSRPGVRTCVCSLRVSAMI